MKRSSETEWDNNHLCNRHQHDCLIKSFTILKINLNNLTEKLVHKRTGINNRKQNDNNHDVR